MCGVGLVAAFRFSIAVCLRTRNGFPLLIAVCAFDSGPPLLAIFVARPLSLQHASGTFVFGSGSPLLGIRRQRSAAFAR